MFIKINLILVKASRCHFCILVNWARQRFLSWRFTVRKIRQTHLFPAQTKLKQTTPHSQLLPAYIPVSTTAKSFNYINDHAGYLSFTSHMCRPSPALRSTCIRTTTSFRMHPTNLDDGCGLFMRFCDSNHKIIRLQ